MTRISRKMDHVRYALSTGQSGLNGLEDVRFVHNPIPESSLDHISLSTRIGDLVMSSPILINAMTGGSPETEEINRGLAAAAKETGIAMAVGSQMSAVRRPEYASTYRIARETNPEGMLFANLGGEAEPEHARRAVDMISANALQIHLNVVQELVMPEGDRSFAGTLRRLERIVGSCGVPVIVKEVGFGMTREAAADLFRIGVTAVDVGGKGGTNFAAIENARRHAPLEWFADWGNTTSSSLLEAASVSSAGCIIASGGIRTSLEAAKAIALGASAVGMAGAFLKVLRETGTEALVRAIRAAQDEIRLVMAALGAGTIAELQRAPVVITGDTAAWCRARDIDISGYGSRKIRSDRADRIE